MAVTRAIFTPSLKRVETARKAGSVATERKASRDGEGGRSAKLDHAIHPGHDPGRCACKTEHGAKTGPENESGRQREDGDRHDDEEVFAAAGQKHQVLRNVAAGAERRKSKYGAENCHVEGEERVAACALKAAADQGERCESDRGGRQDQPGEIDVVRIAGDHKIEESDRNQGAGAADHGQPKPLALGVSEGGLYRS